MLEEVDLQIQLDEEEKKAEQKRKLFQKAFKRPKECYEDGVPVGVTILGKTFREMYKDHGAPTPQWMLDIFIIAIQAMNIEYDPKKHKLNLISNSWMKKENRPDKDLWFIKIGLLGQCDNTSVCYVVETDYKDYRAKMTELIIHEALHIGFGAHPWPLER